MKKFFAKQWILLSFFLFLSLGLEAQTQFNISQVDVSKFPRVRAGFVALDGAGNAYPNLLPSDFNVKENGQFVNASVSIECRDSIVDPSASIILVIDKSGSMGWVNDSNQTRWSWVEEGATEFIKTIKFTNGTQVAIIAFAKTAEIRCPFTTDRPRLLDSLKKTYIGGGTLYEPPIMDPRAGALYMFRTFSPEVTKKRIVIFLTDGDPNTPPPPETDTLLKYLHAEGVIVYGITVAMPMQADLAKISSQTGGKAYAVYTKAALKDIYSYIALEIQRQQFCDIVWTAPFGCTDLSRNRTIDITFKRQDPPINQVVRDYYAPTQSLGKVDLSDNIVSFGDPAVTVPSYQYLTLTPRNSPLRVDNLYTIPNKYFTIDSIDTSGIIKSTPFTIDTGKTLTLKLKFTNLAPGGYRQASLIAEGSPCPPIVPLVGGITEIRIITPNGGEVYSTCDTIIIQWAGIDPKTPVNLTYSMNDGISWQSLANNVTGFSYRWVPPQPGIKYRIKGEVAPKSSFMWAKNEGGAQNDWATSLACLDNEYSEFVTGNFDANTTIGGKNMGNLGGTDLFLAKYDRDGNPLWAVSAGGPGNDSASGVCADPEGNAWVVGTMANGATFGYITPNLKVDNAPYCFLAKYPPGGQTPFVAWIGPDQIWNGFKAWGLKVRYVKKTPPLLDEIYVYGQYTGQYQNSSFSLPKNPTTKGKDFTAIFNPDLTIRYVSTGFTPSPDYSNNFDFDIDGNRYECGVFASPVTFGTFTLKSNGRKDAYINKFGGTPGSKDISDTTFKVEAPQLTLSMNIVDFKDCTLGGYKDSVFTSILCNYGTLPITITSAYFTGVHSADYSLGAALVGQKIEPGKCIPIEIVFTPQDVDSRLAQLIITDACAANVSLNVIGNGVCSGIALDPIDFKDVTLNAKKDSTVICLFKNSNTSSISVKPIIEGINASDFSLSDNKLFLLSPGDCIKMTVTFSPSVPGIRTATIRYEATNCTLPTTTLIGNGIDADVSVTGIDWHGRRVLTQNDSFLVIKNNSIATVKILKIELEDKTNAFFDIIDKIAPFTIPAGGTQQLNIRFTPADEIVYNNSFMMMVENRKDTLYSGLTGSGTLPKILTNWVCDQAVKPGDESIAYIEVINPSTTADLQINTMKVQPVSADFNFDNGVITDNVVVPMKDMKTFNVKFTPQASGNRTAIIKINSDALPGPNKNPNKDTSVAISCNGLGLSVESEINFGSLILCDNFSRDLTVSNISGNSTISVLRYYFEGADSSGFTVSLPSVLDIPSGGFIKIGVVFSPKEKRSYSTKLHIVATSNIEVVVTLNGTGDIVNLYADPNVVKSYPGLTRKIPVKAKIGAFTKPFINNLAITVRFDPKMVQLVNNSITSTLAPWTWDAPDLTNLKTGILKMKGTGTINLPYDGTLFTADWKIFLNESPSSFMYFTSDVSPCVSPEEKAVTIGLQNVCFLNGTLILSGKSSYALLAPQPNPANGDFKLTFGVGLDGYTSISIFNTMGEVVRNVVDEELKSGEYELHVPVGQLSSGVYMIKMVSGPFTKTENLIINK